jgi:hypothetical protein
MQLSPDLEAQYDNFVIKHKNEEEDMRVASQSMQDFINRASKEFFGQSLAEVINEKQEAINEKQELIKREIRSIINLKDKMNLNVEQIASVLELDIHFVKEVLDKYEK